MQRGRHAYGLRRVARSITVASSHSHGTKAVGERPLMLAIGVVTALRRASAAFRAGEVELGLPVTPAVLREVPRQRGAV